MATAVEAIKSVYSDAVVRTERNDNYPIKVIISTGGRVIFETSQKDLFRKYGARRDAAIKNIQAVVKALGQGGEPEPEAKR